MCGRFLLIDLSIVAETFGIEDIRGDFATGTNISPGMPIAAVIRRDGKNRLVGFRWGLVPSWARDPAIGQKLINARAETIAEKPGFKAAFQKRRCLIPADGFYEWQKAGRVKKPLCFSLKSGAPFALAGLYETWITPQGERLDTCTIITTEPNELTRPAHDRMPVIVPKERHAFWLDPANGDRSGLLSLLKPYPAAEMTVRDVDPADLAAVRM